jgi:hypothetical protein
VSGLIFMFCAPGLILGGTEGVRSNFKVLRSRTRFRRYRGRPIPFSCFALQDSFSAVPRALGPFFMFCAPRLIFSGTEGVSSCFHVVRSRTRFRRYRGRRVPFSCFALPDSISAVPSASGPIFVFCAPRLIFGDTEGVGSCFHVLRSRTHFRWHLGRRVKFSSFALEDSFSVVPRASDPVFMFCAPGLVFDGAERVGSLFLVLRAQTQFQRYRGRQFLFSCCALPDTFLSIPRASGLVFRFCAPGLIFDSVECVGSHFHVLRARIRFRRYRGR